jgi:glucose-6-phosphate isomerase
MPHAGATWRERPRCDRTVAWGQLQSHFEGPGARFDLRTAFAEDPLRFAAFSQEAPFLFADLSKNLIDPAAEALLRALARECRLEAHRDALFAGQAVNTTENRAALHTLLRTPRDAPHGPADHPQQRERLAGVHATLDAMLAFAESVRADGGITDVVNIGIGGSDLGPRMVVRALLGPAGCGPRVHFVSNVDGHELEAVLRPLQPGHTLFLVASKSFTTPETLLNAHSARRWFAAGGGTDVGRHFVGLTSHPETALAFGIRTTFGFEDWVGGRYSLWSAIGLPVAIALGATAFRELLAGAHAMDQHFRTAPLAHNLPVRLALLDLWYRDFHRFSSRNIAPYHSGLRYLAMHLQQVEMESNGKQVDRFGRPVTYGTAPVLWGEPGCNGQHAFFQMLHQGTDVVPVEFIAVREPTHPLPGHHEKLLANALAQAQALMLGQPDVSGHRHFPGNRPSTFVLLERLDAASLGALIALQEHRVFTSGSLWGINSFDQWGVELGKSLAQDIEPRLSSGVLNGLDPSTAGLIGRLRQGRPPAAGV